jgi:two-component system, response regulator RegA
MTAPDVAPDHPLLLVVEDDDVLRRRLARAMSDRGFTVREAASVSAARSLVAEDPPEFVLLDLRVEDGSTLDFAAELLAIDPATRIVVLTGYGSIATAIEALKRGVVHYLTKPADADEILAAFERGADGDPIKPSAVQPMSLARAEWEYINRVLVACGGNLSEAARTLKLHRRSLQRKLAKYPVRE